MILRSKNENKASASRKSQPRWLARVTHLWFGGSRAKLIMATVGCERRRYGFARFSGVHHLRIGRAAVWHRHEPVRARQNWKAARPIDECTNSWFRRPGACLGQIVRSDRKSVV